MQERITNLSLKDAQQNRKPESVNQAKSIKTLAIPATGYGGEREPGAYEKAPWELIIWALGAFPPDDTAEAKTDSDAPGESSSGASDC